MPNDGWVRKTMSDVKPLDGYCEHGHQMAPGDLLARYCHGCLWTEISRLTAEVERLGRCLRIATGMLSTIEEFKRCHPEEVLAYIEATEVGSRDLDGEP